MIYNDFELNYDTSNEIESYTGLLDYDEDEDGDNVITSSLTTNIEDRQEEVKEEEPKKKSKSYEEKERLSSLKKMYIFKNFIGFLEIWGQENYGERFEVNWTKVHRIIIENNMFDFNDDLDNILYNSDIDYESEEFRDQCYSYIENQVLSGLPIWTLFDLSDYLRNIYIKEDEEKRRKEDIKLFNKYKCFKCKHFIDGQMVAANFSFYHIEEFKERFGEERLKVSTITHGENCTIRLNLLKDNEVKFGRFHDTRDTNKIFRKEECPNNFLYETYNERDWKFIPLTSRCKCKFYEEDETHNTYDKFIEKFIELFVPSKDDDD